MIDDTLLAAYRATRYTVLLPGGELPGGELVVRIGEFSPAMDALLTSERAASATFVTAWNPMSRPVPKKANTAAQKRLETELASAGHRWLPQEGRADAGDWPPEPGCLVLGLTRERALGLAERYGQNAVVWCVPGSEPELLLTRLAGKGAVSEY